MNIKESYLNHIIPEGLEIIDAHTHFGKTSSNFLKRYSVDKCVETSIKLGIRKLCASSMISLGSDLSKGNRMLFDITEKYPDNVFGYVVYNPRQSAASIVEIDKYISHKNFIGVKMHPGQHNYSISGENYNPLWDYAAEKGFPILCHTWETDVVNYPALFTRVLDKCPQLKILLGHSGGTYEGYASCYRLMKEFPNVYMDLNGFLYSMRWIEQVVEETDENRLLFSTDQVWNEPRVTLGKIVLSEITEEQKHKILCGNFLTMLGRNI